LDIGGLSDPAKTEEVEGTTEIHSVPYKGNLVCIGVLPGLSSYNDSSSEHSDDDGDSTTDSEKQSPPGTRDLCGRRIVEQEQKPAEKKN
jgi:hypothetical protein